MSAQKSAKWVTNSQVKNNWLQSFPYEKNRYVWERAWKEMEIAGDGNSFSNIMTHTMVVIVRDNIIVPTFIAANFYCTTSAQEIYQKGNKYAFNDILLTKIAA